MKHVLMAALIAVLMANCGKEPECPTCLNNGVCVNGSCECPEGWDGVDCSDPVLPIYVSITGALVSGFPMVRSTGGGWDSNGSGPDIQISLSADITGELLYESGVLDNVANNSALTINGRWVMSPMPQSVRIKVWDDDEVFGRELMCSGTVEVWNVDSGWRPVIISIQNGVSYGLMVEYNK